MKEFGPEEKSILDSIVASDCPWVTVQSLPANGIYLASLITEGLVELWSTNSHNQQLCGGPYITLTPLGCEILGVTLTEYSEALPPQTSRLSQNGQNPFDGWFPHWDPVDRETGWGIHDNRPIRLIDLPWFFHRSPLPELLVNSHPAPNLLTNEDGEPIRLFTGHGDGYTIAIDHRLNRKVQIRLY